MLGEVASLQEQALPLLGMIAEGLLLAMKTLLLQVQVLLWATIQEQLLAVETLVL